MKFTRRLVPFVGAVALMAAALPLHAQRFGIMAGATFSNLRSSDDLNFENRTGTTFGATLQLPLGSSITLQPEALFINKGSKFDSPTAGEGNIRLDYFEVPVLLRYDFSREVLAPHIYAGPSVGFNVGCKVKIEDVGTIPNTSSDCEEENFKPKSVDYGFTVGAGLDLNLGGLAATGGVRYGIGLADIRNDNSQEFKSRVNNGTLSLYVGLLFGSLKKN
jgi:hypothetical protein